MAAATTTVSATDIVAAAQAVKSHDDAVALNHMITAPVGVRHRRPLGDVWNDFGLVSQAGDFDRKVIEAVTNAQDAVIEPAARPDGRPPD